MSKVQSNITTVRLSNDVLESLKIYASKKHISISEAIRIFVEKGLSIESYTAEQDTLRQIIREEIEVTLDKPIDRLIRLILKGTKASAASMYAQVATLSLDYSDDADMENILANALKEAAVYMKQKEQPVEKYLSEAKEIKAAAEKLTKVIDI